MAIADEMRERLEAAFSPARLEIEDRSDRHRGHAGWREGGGTHWHVLLRAEALAGLSRLARHRAVHAALGDVVPRIHALEIDAG